MLSFQLIIKMVSLVSEFGTWKGETWADAVMDLALAGFGFVVLLSSHQMTPRQLVEL